MDRRRFLKTSTTIGGLGVPVLSQNTIALPDGFESGLDYLITDFLNDDWNLRDLEDELEDALDVVCYAYGKFEELGEDDVEVDEDPGFLEQLTDLTWEELQDSPETYEWLLQYLSEFVVFVSAFDAFSDDVADAMEKGAEIVEKSRNLAKFIPVAWSLKNVCDAGCEIHEKLEGGRFVSQDAYIDFLQAVALLIVEIVLLATGVGGAYKAAFKTVGGVNRLLVNRVGKQLTWAAYSRLLSVTHWGIRVVYAESFGKAIEETTDVVAKELKNTGEISQSRANELAEADVNAVAEKSDEGLFESEYERYEFNLWSWLSSLS